jgi:argininosuccinate lyase
MLSEIKVRKDILLDDKYKFLFTVDEVNKLVMSGTPFREAYKIVGKKVEDGTYKAPALSDLERGVHEGSIGNLGNAEIRKTMSALLDSFPFAGISQALRSLLQQG